MRLLSDDFGVPWAYFNQPTPLCSPDCNHIVAHPHAVGTASARLYDLDGSGAVEKLAAEIKAYWREHLAVESAD